MKVPADAKAGQAMLVPVPSWEGAAGSNLSSDERVFGPEKQSNLPHILFVKPFRLQGGRLVFWKTIGDALIWISIHFGFSG